MRGELVGNRLGPDERGIFYELMVQSKFTAITGKPFSVAQTNVVTNVRGAIRGMHAEKWDKLICNAKGRIQVAYLDCRDQETFGNYETFVLDTPSVVFVPAGVANSYLSLDDDVVYIYLTTSEWQADQVYPGTNLLDPELAIPWQSDIPFIMSEKDKALPPLKEVFPELWQRWRVKG
jgi:dTDP-4-dehydrorhamnose 3,5-epimerase